MVHVRRVTIRDFDAVVAMGHRFCATHKSGEPLDEAAFEQFFTTALPGHPAAIWVAVIDGKPIGMMAGLIYPLFFNPSRAICQELFWWVDEEKRFSGAAADLLDAWETWGRDMGATRFLLTSPVTGRIDAVERLYGSYGYSPLERTYVKDV